MDAQTEIVSFWKVFLNGGSSGYRFVLPEDCLAEILKTAADSLKELEPQELLKTEKRLGKHVATQLRYANVKCLQQLFLRCFKVTERVA